MYTNCTSECVSAITSSVRQLSAKLCCRGIDTTYQSELLSFSLTQSSSVGDNPQFGAAVSASLEFELLGVNANLMSREVELYIGATLGDGTTEYIPCGVYTVSESKYTSGKLSCKAFDRLNKASMAYQSQLTFPATSSAILNEICATLGVLYSGDTLSAITVRSAPTGTVKDVIGYLAGLYGKFAVMDRSGNLIFKWYENKGYAVNLAIAEPPSMSPQHSIGYYSCVADDKTYVSGQGIYGINFECPMMTQARLDAIYADIGNVIYFPAEISLKLGDPRLDVWDLITYDGKLLLSMEISHSWDGGLQTTITSKADAQTEEDAEYVSPAEKKEQETNDKITKLQSANTILNNRISGNVLLDVDEDGNYNRLLIMDSQSPETATKVWEFGINGWGYSNNCIGVDNPNRDWKIAATLDGVISADFVRSGVLQSPDGTLQINLGDGVAGVIGKITATSGTLGGFTIADKYLYGLNDSTGKYTLIKTNGDVAMAFGSPGYATAAGSNLQIFHDGRLRSGSDTTAMTVIDKGTLSMYYNSVKLLDIVPSYTSVSQITQVEFRSPSAFYFGSSATNYYRLAVSDAQVSIIGNCRHRFNGHAKFSNNLVVDGSLYATTLTSENNATISVNSPIAISKYISGNTAIGTGQYNANLTVYGDLTVSSGKNCTITGSLTANTASITNLSLTTLTGGTASTGDITLSNAKAIKGKETSGTAYNLIGFNTSNNLVIGNTSQSGWTNIYSNSRINLLVDGTQIARITSDGFVGVKDTFYFNNSDGNTLISLASAGIGIGHTSYTTSIAGSRINIGNSDSTVYIKGSVYSSSDMRLKNTITPLSNKYTALLDHLNAKTFRYNGDNKGKINCGFIAQELLTALSDVGLTTNEFAGFDCDENGMMSIGYEQFIPIMWQILKNLKRKVEQYESN